VERNFDRGFKWTKNHLKLLRFKITMKIVQRDIEILTIKKIIFLKKGKNKK